MIKKIICLSVFLWTSLVLAESGTKILAVIGDEAITLNDVQKRYNVMIATNNITITTPEENQALSRQVLQSLINEKIFLQEAKKLKITATDKEIQNVIKHIEEQQHVAPGHFEDFLQSKNIAKEDALTQISNSIIWEKMLEQVIARQVHVSNKELNEYIEKAHLQDLQTDLYLFTANGEGARSHLNSLYKTVRSCPVQEMVFPESIKMSHLTGKAKDLPKELQNKIASVTPGHKTPIFTNNKQAQFFILCEKKSNLTNEQIQQIRGGLLDKKMQLQADYYMKNLSKKTFVEIYP